MVGSLNTDLSARVSRHPRPGETVAGSPLSMTPGGKGANQAVAAARLGARVSIIGRVGDDNHAGELLRGLRDDNVDTTHVRTTPDTSTGTAMITVSDDGENSIVVSAAANDEVSGDDVRRAVDHIGSARVVSLVPEIPVAALHTAALIAREHATRVVLNLSPVIDVDDELLRLADPLIVNEHEARQLWRGPDGAAAEASTLAREVLRLGPRSVVVTRGAHGAVIATPEATTEIPAVPTEAVDTTGAGDAFAAALCWRLVEGDTMTTSARWAAHVSALTIGHHGSQPSYPAQEALSVPGFDE
ncbi:ribokinase [Actinopolyspora lacussalsi]|uniref:ribokinase n=1 Tax=Actinopolyspora righensis TaxID=995060 RepID=UPI001FE95760|nr:ribokinase [Actinopolyspora righensis]